jgi:hypothetical protein
MVEKFADFEGMGFLSEEGEFEFEITNAELKESKAGSPMVQLDAKSDKGQTTLYHSLNEKARWSYNKLIAACLKLTDEEKKTFELDYQTIGQQLIGKKFIGVVEEDTYEKPIKRMLDDGTFEDDVEVKTSYKIKEYKPCV